MAGGGSGTLKAVALITGGGPNLRGSVQFFQQPNGPTHVRGKISGLSPGLHGFHIHALGDTTNGCNSTGPHFNPLKKDHGAPTGTERHAGDMGNITAGSDGVAEFSITDAQIPLSGPYSILGRAVVVHADPDDLGKVQWENIQLHYKKNVVLQVDMNLARRLVMPVQELDVASLGCSLLFKIHELLVYKQKKALLEDVLLPQNGRAQGRKKKTEQKGEPWTIGSGIPLLGETV